MSQNNANVYIPCFSLILCFFKLYWLIFLTHKKAQFCQKNPPSLKEEIAIHGSFLILQKYFYR